MLLSLLNQTARRPLGSQHHHHHRPLCAGRDQDVSLWPVGEAASAPIIPLVSSRAASSGGVLVRVALQLVELDAVQLLEALLAELAGEVVVRLRGVLLHVPVEGRPLAALVAADLTPDQRTGWEEEERREP